MISTQGLLKLLACETKIKIICGLFQTSEGMTVSDLKQLGCLTSRSNYSKQINELRRHGVVTFTKVGRRRFYTINKALPSVQIQMLQAIVQAFNQSPTIADQCST